MNIFRTRLRTSPILALAMVVALVGFAGEAQALVNRASMDVTTRYLLRSHLSYANGTISTSETIWVRNVSGAAISKVNLSVMPRAFGELTAISDFRADGKVVTAAWTKTSNLEVQLGRDVAHGETAIVTLKFSVRASGTIDTSLQGRLSKANGIMQVSHWFPIVSNGHDVRYPGDSQVTRTATKIRLELTTDSSSVRIAAPGLKLAAPTGYHVYEMDNTRDFAFGASPYYKIASGSAAGVGVVAYYTTGNAAAALSVAKAALVTFEAAFGQYQWPRYVIAQTGRAGSGNEYPGIIFLGGPMFSNSEVVAHETAHQWWYAMAGNDQMMEPWLDEGIAEFAASYFYGGFHSYSSTRPVNSSIYEFPNVPAPQTSSDPNSYDQTIYFKSASFLNGLRSRMGSSAFFNGLRAFFAANRNGVMTTREFYDTMARYGASTTYMRQFVSL